MEGIRLEKGPPRSITDSYPNGWSFDTIPDALEANERVVEKSCEGWHEDIPKNHVNDDRNGTASGAGGIGGSGP